MLLVRVLSSEFFILSFSFFSAEGALRFTNEVWIPGSLQRHGSLCPHAYHFDIDPEQALVHLDAVLKQNESFRMNRPCEWVKIVSNMFYLYIYLYANYDVCVVNIIQHFPMNWAVFDFSYVFLHFFTPMVRVPTLYNCLFIS